MNHNLIGCFPVAKVQPFFKLTKKICKKFADFFLYIFIVASISFTMALFKFSAKKEKDDELSS
jgi:hypothetical protein